MRKITWIMAILLVFSCLCVTVQAQEADGLYTIALSEDHRTAVWNGDAYQCFDAAGILLLEDDMPWDALLTTQQRQTLKRITVTSYNAQTVLELEIRFTDGASMTACYLREDLVAEYTAILSGEAEACQIDFLWPEGNIVEASRSGLLGREVTLTAEELEWCDSFEVSFVSSGGELQIVTGAVLVCDGLYYYVDFSQNGIVYDEYGFYPYDYTSLSGWEITDGALLEELDGAMNAFYADSFGFFSDDSLTEAISRVFLVLAFGVVPVGLFVVFLILSLRAKGQVYRRLFRVVWILAAAEAAVFAAVMMVLW